MTETDLIMIEGVWRGQLVNWETTNPDTIKYLLNELEAEDLQKVSPQIRGQIKPLTVTLFNLGSQVKQFTALDQLINDGRQWFKSHRRVQSMIADLLFKKV